MELETIFLDSKWLILTELSHRKLSPTELAKKTGTTIANISTQLRLLEALDFVKSERLSNVGKGQPRKLFSLKKEFAYVVLCTNTVAGKKLFKINDEEKYFFSVWMMSDQVPPFVMMKFYLDNMKKLEDAVSIGFLGKNGKEIELVIVHPNPESLYYINQINLEHDNKQYNFKVHVHKKEDFLSGIDKKEDYFISLVKKAFILLDKESILSKTKKGAK